MLKEACTNNLVIFVNDDSNNDLKFGQLAPFSPHSLAPALNR